MADFTFITGESKRWRDFFASIREGESVSFTASTPAEVEVVRAVASNINTKRVHPYVYSVKGDMENLKVTISTRERL